MFAMGYNGREIRDSSYKVGAPSNGLSSEEVLAASMSGLSVDPIAAFPANPFSLSRSTSTSSARTHLNPNAAEFVPSALKSAPPAPEWEPEKSPPKQGVGSRLDRTDSSNSNASDDEYRRFCRSQLPDDLMPDFDFGDFVESRTPEYEESVEVSGGASNWSGGNVGSALPGDQFNFDERVVPSASARAAPYSPRFGVVSEGSSSAGYVRPYMPELRGSVSSRQQQQQPPAWSDGNESASALAEWGGSELTFPEDLSEAVDPVSVLASEFPGFASESLAEIFYANGGDLSLTMDMLSELELQNEGASGRQFQAAPVPAPPSSRDFPALSGLESVPRQQLSGRATVGESRPAPDFAAAVRKQQAAQLQFERNGGVDLSLRGLSPGPGVGGYPREGRVAPSPSDRLDPFHLHGHEVQAPAAWLETGDSVANMYADMREEARDHARVRNAYFDQARQAFLTGNKALAKELSAQGQWHNERMKAAHSKAGEAIFWQRNSNGFVNSSNSPGQPQLIDLHGLHVGEAIPLLKREIAQLRYNVTRTRQRAHVFICVGTGHHTKGSRTPSRLPAAVQRYLLEEEHLQFIEPQAGMLRIIIR